QVDAALVHTRKAGGDLRPRLAAVGAAADGGLGAAVDQCEDVPAALVRRGEQHVGVTRVEDDVVDPRVLADVQNAIPALSAGGGLVQPAVAAGPPQRPLGGDVDGVAVARVDDDLADVLRLLQPDLLPAGAAVDRLVQPVAVADAALAVVLAGADPDGVRRLGV